MNNFNTKKIIQIKNPGLPPFSALPLLFLVMVKPLTDAFYEVEAIKYIYILLLICASLFARGGQDFQGDLNDPRNKSLFPYIWLILTYFIFNIALAIVFGGSISEIFKIISPFVFFVLVAYAADRWLLYALGIGAVLNILINAATLPLDYGWIQWGGTQTFKGFYFFKTDLAYSLCFSVLLCFFFMKNRITSSLAILTIIATVEVVLANSRINYACFLLVIIFMVTKEGVSIRNVIRYGSLIILLLIVVYLTYDPSKLLGFDTSNESAFTQGRDSTWQRLINSMLISSPNQWLFGRGAFADVILAQEALRGTQNAHNAHNEILHLLYTQGIFGTTLYTLLWLKTFQMSCRPTVPDWARGTATVALGIFLLQSLTTVVSSFATKTWPLVMVLLAIRGLTRNIKSNNMLVNSND
ncbi:MAG: O-antigen ligase family protein [Polaromonas sp.]|nr:O-antigen ligase family protein [Polaromonas sp.]